MLEAKCMNENRQILVAVSALVVVAMVVGIAVANAYNSTAQANPYVGYGANYGPYGYSVPYGPPPSNFYGPYGKHITAAATAITLEWAGWVAWAGTEWA
jgi:hypothetical protein